jgi:hypothetical protein
LALLSVLGGIQALGPIGILVGPMVVVFLQVLLKLVQREMSSLDKSTWFNWPGFAAFAQRATARAPGGAEPLAADTATPPSSASTENPPPAGNGHADANRPREAGQQPQHGKKRKK